MATKPETSITITFINFLKSLTNKAKNVKGTAKLSPSFSGIAAPSIIPKNVVAVSYTHLTLPTNVQV